MRARASYLVCFACLIWSATAASEARADAPTAARCFERGALLSAAEELGGRAIDADFYERVLFELHREGRGYALRVSVAGEIRDTHVATCREGLRAAALIVALAFDEATVSHGADLVVDLNEQPAQPAEQPTVHTPVIEAPSRMDEVSFEDASASPRPSFWLSTRAGAELLLSSRTVGAIDVSVALLFGRMRASLGGVLYSGDDLVSTEPGVAILEQRAAGRARISYSLLHSEYVDIALGVGCELGALSGESRGLRVRSASKASGLYATASVSPQIRFLPNDWLALVASVDAGVKLAGPRFEIDGLGPLETPSHFAVCLLVGLEARMF